MDSENTEKTLPPRFRDLGQKPPRQELPPEVDEKIRNMTQKEYAELPFDGSKKGKTKPGTILPGKERHTSGFGNFQNKDMEYRGTNKG